MEITIPAAVAGMAVALILGWGCWSLHLVWSRLRRVEAEQLVLQSELNSTQDALAATIRKTLKEQRRRKAAADQSSSSSARDVPTGSNSTRHDLGDGPHSYYPWQGQAEQNRRDARDSPRGSRTPSSHTSTSYQNNHPEFVKDNLTRLSSFSSSSSASRRRTLGSCPGDAYNPERYQLFSTLSPDEALKILEKMPGDGRPMGQSPLRETAQEPSSRERTDAVGIKRILSAPTSAECEPAPTQPQMIKPYSAIPDRSRGSHELVGIGVGLRSTVIRVSRRLKSRKVE